MAIDFFIDPLTGDIDITNNLIRRTLTIEELTRQQIAITLEAFRGEWIYNITYGVPYLANDNNDIQLLGKVDPRLIDAALAEAILGRTNVTGISDYASVVNEATREMSVSFTAVTKSGEIIPFENFIINA